MDAKKTLRPNGLYLCLVGLLLISYSITLRVDPNFISAHLLQNFHITMENFAELTIRYQFTLLFTLIFAGFIVDLIGTRTVLIIAAITATLGNNLFANATDLHTMANGRIMVAFAHPFLLIGVIKLGTEWLPKKYFTLFVAAVFTVLLITPQIVTIFMATWVKDSGWKSAMDVLNLLAVLLIIGLLLSCTQRMTTAKVSFRNTCATLLKPLLWLTCIISCFGWLANTFFLNWGSFFLANALHFPPDLAAKTIRETFSCFAFGTLVFGLLANITRYKHSLLTGGYWIAALALGFVLTLSNLSPPVIASLLFVVGLGASAAILCYTKTYDYCVPTSTGLAFGLVAFVTTAGNTCFAWLISRWLTPLAQHPALESGHSWAVLAVIPAALVLGGLLALLLRKP